MEQDIIITDHCYRRYIERVKNGSSESEYKMKEEIKKLFNSSEEYYKGVIGYSDSQVRVFCNKNGWTFITSEDGKKLVTVYKVDLNVDSPELNQMYVDKALAKITNLKESYDTALVKAKEEQATFIAENKEIDDKIKEYKKMIRDLEERKDALFKASSTAFTNSNAIHVELRDALQDFMIRDKLKIESK